MKKIKQHNSLKKMLLFGLILCLSLQVPVYAKSSSKKPTCAASQTVYISSGWPASIYSYIFIKNISYSSKISNIKCSNSKITATSMLKEDSSGIKMKALRLDSSASLSDGEKATLSFQVKQNGKTYKLSCKLTFKNMPSLARTFKIGKTDYASELTATGIVIDFPSSSQKITWKSAKGCRIVSIYVQYFDGSCKTIKNGAVVNLKNVETINITYKLKKPANYQTPAKWNSTTSPLQGFMQIVSSSAGIG